MSDYIGKICPYCKTAFKPGDDIVLCSACDMPHHKDCWIENQGCTTFGCTGTIKAADNAESSVTATQMHYDDPGSANAPANSEVVFCTQCGAKNSSASSFCTSCGSKLVTAQESVTQPPVYTQADPRNNDPYAYVNRQANPYQGQNQYQNYGGYNGYQSYQTTEVEAEVRQLVGVKAEYYIPQFQRLKAAGKQMSWNWAAFWVTPFWLIYRKMYGYAAAFFAVNFIFALIGSDILSLLTFAGYIAFGILGNNIYMKHLEGKANLAKAMSEPYKSQFIAAEGGVNTVATAVAVIACVLLYIIL